MQEKGSGLESNKDLTTDDDENCPVSKEQMLTPALMPQKDIFAGRGVALGHFG